MQLRFGKKNIKQKEKNSVLLYPGLCYAHKKLFLQKCLFEYKIRKKNSKKVLGNFKITWKNFYYRHQKNASHANSIYGNCMIRIF